MVPMHSETSFVRGERAPRHGIVEVARAHDAEEARLEARPGPTRKGQAVNSEAVGEEPRREAGQLGVVTNPQLITDPVTDEAVKEAGGADVPIACPHQDFRGPPAAGGGPCRCGGKCILDIVDFVNVNYVTSSTTSPDKTNLHI